MPKIVDHDVRRKEISDIAVELFSEIGFDASSMQKIADRAGIAKGSIYKYFDSKEKLLMYVTVDFLDGIKQSLQNFESSRRPPERLREILHWVVNLAESHRQLFKVYTEIWTSNLRGSYPEMMALFEHHLEFYRQITVETIQEGQRTGEFRKALDADDLAVYLVASLDGIVLHTLYSENRFDSFRVVNTFLDALLSGLGTDL